MHAFHRENLRRMSQVPGYDIGLPLQLFWPRRSANPCLGTQVSRLWLAGDQGLSFRWARSGCGS